MEQTRCESRCVLCTLLDKHDQSKCTNGEDVWKTPFSELMKKLSLKSTDDYTLKLKGACSSGRAFVRLQGCSAVLHLGAEPTDPSLTLSKLTDSEGRTEVKELLFKMADSLSQLESEGTSSFCPVKSPQKRTTEFELRNQPKGPIVAVRKRLPGDSLINPGTRRKKPATGVAFDDPDD